jgi:hypothetical protein
MNEVVATILFWTGVILSLAFKVPTLAAWWELQTKLFKTYATLGLNVFAGILVVIVACAGIPGITVPVTCDIVGVGDVIIGLGIIFGGNQLAYNIVKSKS